MTESNPRELLEHARADEQAAEKLLEVAHVAKRLKRCPETIRRYIRAGRLRAQRTPGFAARGGNYLIPESAVRDFLATPHNMMRQSPV